MLFCGLAVLVLLWDVMLICTALFFHIMIEKVTYYHKELLNMRDPRLRDCIAGLCDLRRHPDLVRPLPGHLRSQLVPWTSGRDGAFQIRHFQVTMTKVNV